MPHRKTGKSPAPVEPTDVEHIVGDEEFFFSTTDRKGIIEQANSVFVRLSRYGHHVLAGAPHNIIRHPDMPGGAFKLVWDQLENGRPACAYVKNMAADGGAYWVFATLLPVGDKYLSVRMNPLVGALKEASESLYTSVRPAEVEAREKGASRDEAATLGLGLLAEGLAPLGISDADDLAMLTLPQEVSAHERAGSLPMRPEATGPAAELLQVMHTIHADTAALVAQLDEYDSLVTDLENSARDAGPAADRLTRILDTVEPTSGRTDLPEMLPEFTRRIDGEVQAAIDGLANLDGRLTDLASLVRRLRMRIALLRLHNRMVGLFCAELVDGDTSFDADASMQMLTHALDDGASDLATAMTEVRTALAQVPDLVRDTVRNADRTQRFSTKWRGEAGTGPEDVTASLAPVVAALTEISVEGFAELHRFYEVAARCAALPDHFDERALTDQVAHMREHVEALTRSHAA